MSSLAGIKIWMEREGERVGGLDRGWEGEEGMGSMRGSWRRNSRAGQVRTR